VHASPFAYLSDDSRRGSRLVRRSLAAFVHVVAGELDDRDGAGRQGGRGRSDRCDAVSPAAIDVGAPGDVNLARPSVPLVADRRPRPSSASVAAHPSPSAKRGCAQGRRSAVSSLVGRPQPPPSLVAEPAQRVDIALVDRGGVGKRRHGAVDAGLAQKMQHWVR